MKFNKKKLLLLVSILFLTSCGNKNSNRIRVVMVDTNIEENINKDNNKDKENKEENSVVDSNVSVVIDRSKVEKVKIDTKENKDVSQKVSKDKETKPFINFTSKDGVYNAYLLADSYGDKTKNDNKASVFDIAMINGQVSILGSIDRVNKDNNNVLESYKNDVYVFKLSDDFNLQIEDDDGNRRVDSVEFSKYYENHKNENMLITIDVTGGKASHIRIKK